MNGCRPILSWALMFVIAPSLLRSGDTGRSPSIPRTPKQVFLPPLPPMRYVPGLEEPLVATGPVGLQETAALDAAIAAFRAAPEKNAAVSDFDDYAKPLLSFATAHPLSNWNAALFTDIGFGYYHAGYYSRAFAAWKEAWRRGRDATAPQAKLMVDRAVGELAKMHARVGHDAELNALLADIGKRPLGGPGAQTVEGAREGLWAFRHNPDAAYLCGPKALKNLLVTLRAGTKQIETAEDARSGPHGFSLAELAALSDKAKLRYRLIFRRLGQPVPVPSIINWNVHHYAAITDTLDGRYLVNDPTFGDGGRALTEKAIDAEGSGYFLVPATVAERHADSGWRSVSPDSSEARTVYGMGLATGWTPGNTMFHDICIFCGLKNALNWLTNGTPQMTVANAHTMAVSLNLSDTPVGYRPQRGIPNMDRITYNSREAEQPANFSFSNMSANWTHSWQAYIEDNPQQANYYPTRIASGGGGYYYYGGLCSATTGVCNPETPDNSQLVRNPPKGPLVSWIRNMPDGSREVYGLSNGAKTYPRLVFLTEVTDSAGNTTTIHYDSSFRITSVTDATGRATTFSYGLTTHPLLITRITDPFGRAAQFTYDASARLASITDPIGITSSFSYSPAESTFVSALTTPYGISKFSDTINPKDTQEKYTRSLTLTDPMGYTDYLYFYQNSSITPGSDPADTVPTGMPGIANTLLSWRNTYYWNKHAFALGVTMSGGVVTSEDFGKAALTHWYHWEPNDYAYSQISSLKQPLENRVWVTTFGAYAGLWNGTLDEPTAVGRVLDDGTSQVSKATYKTSTPNGGTTVSPWPLTRTDPKGRETQYAYAANNIDLLSVEQKTSASGFTTIAAFGDYNTQHEPQTYTGPDGQTWRYAYNASGQLTSVTDPDSATTRYNYDGLGRLETVVNANEATALTLSY